MNWLDKISDAERILDQSSVQLSKLANAFSMTGNERVAQELWAISNDINESVVKIQKAVNQELDESLKKAGEMSRSILESALAGIKIEKGEKK